MKKAIFKILAKTNKALIPSFSTRGIDLANAKKWHMAIIGWRYFVTKNSL